MRGSLHFALLHPSEQARRGPRLLHPSEQARRGPRLRASVEMTAVGDWESRLIPGDGEGDFQGADLVGDAVEDADAKEERAGEERELLMEHDGGLDEALVALGSEIEGVAASARKE